MRDKAKKPVLFKIGTHFTTELYLATARAFIKPEKKAQKKFARVN